MSKPTRRRALPTPRDVGGWLLAPLRVREAPDPPRSWLGRRAPWFAVAAALLTVLVSYDGTRGEGFGLGGPAEVAVTSAALVVALLGWRPMVAWRLAAATVALWLVVGPRVAQGYVVLPTAQVVVLALAGVVVLGRHRRDLGWAVWAWSVVLMLLSTIGWGVTAYVVVFTLVVLLVDARRQRTRARADAVREREARLRREGESMVLEERTRIARELHDVVAHHMSMVAVQAETAQYRLGGMPDPVREELASIARSARAALGEVRGILTVLRDVDAGAERAPQPGLGGLEDLVGQARDAGADVTLRVEGRRRPLPAALEIGGYRIVQESLANAARHAPGAATEVTVTYGRRELTVVVTNGPPEGAVGRPQADDAPGVGGHGLVGMRERAHLLGGEVVAGPDPDGGFRVAATLPVTEVTV